MTQHNQALRINPKNRRWARRFALQALYQWEISQQTLDYIESHYRKNKNINRADYEYFKEILYGVPKNLQGIEVLLKRYIDRSLEEIDPIELTILRIACYELIERLDVPYRVVLNEALELGKLFGATDGYKFVNGILDKISREVRRPETLQPHDHS